MKECPREALDDLEGGRRQDKCAGRTSFLSGAGETIAVGQCAGLGGASVRFSAKNPCKCGGKNHGGNTGVETRVCEGELMRNQTTYSTKRQYKADLE